MKRPVVEQINLKMKDTYISPALGLKYSHERLLEKYKHGVLAAKNERYMEVLQQVKERAKPMDHDELYKQRLEYVLNRMQKKKERDDQREKNVREF